MEFLDLFQNHPVRNKDRIVSWRNMKSFSTNLYILNCSKELRFFFTPVFQRHYPEVTFPISQKERAKNLICPLHNH